ncbi:MAG: glutathione S-transferase family protein [Luteimonas sp.]
MIRITALKWVPPFAAGQVRDHRLRWVLREVGWPYEVRLLDAPALKSTGYSREQPFGQVPAMEEDGRPTLFESGAVVLDVALRANRLLPEDAGERSLAICWLVAALNSIEPALMNVAEVAYFTRDGRQQAVRRPVVETFARQRLQALQAALGDRTWIVGGDFSVADLMLCSVLKIADRLDLLDDVHALRRYAQRGWDRPAHREAIAEQCATIEAHGEADMRYGDL